jgi:hypothetical protein
MPAPPGAARCTNPIWCLRVGCGMGRATTPNAHSGLGAQPACLATRCLRAPIHHA